MDENLLVCAVLETHVKNRKLQKIGDNIFGNWNWITNMNQCDKGCRIMIGWHSDEVSVTIIHSAKQSILCKIESVDGSVTIFCSFVYAANSGIERRMLWKDLNIYKRIVGNGYWVLLEDFNVTLNPNEHSAGGSYMTSDMTEFKDCVNQVEIEDISSNGLFYTWTKNLHKVRAGDYAGVLKKLDRSMGNEEVKRKATKPPYSSATFGV
ncbi:RNA-directed DNA polymerase, eukaryota, Reverse transcriptase zinc-binding domain protein [Artemisia annua]|uniref:RNA-directed DNA polymerase, eukaryota, Reverse transcriptase zinc-binding domain protein n=1 Tax=Artemisia annua TaxID=35608 RepID=A0A2U1MWB4_ARTAN|nr:RNA-directed DNA polymerase, eukaryota, Reverse transcriptase zinc-binding domain protein [Artemisia annua]